MQLMLKFFSAYPWRTVWMLIALLVSSLAEGLGLTALLPFLNVAMESSAALPGIDQANSDAINQKILGFLDALNIEPTLTNMLGILMVGVTFKSVFLLLAQRQVGYTAAQVGTDLRLEMLQAVMRGKWEYFISQPVGKLTNALATEAQRSSEAFINGATALTYLIQGITYGAVAFFLSWQASLIAIVAGAIVIGLSYFLVRMTRAAGGRQTRLLSTLMVALTDTLQSVKPLKAMAREESAEKVLTDRTNQLNLALRKQVKSAALLNSAHELLFAIFICWGIYMALEVYSMAFTTVMVLVVALGRAFAFFSKVQKQYQKLVQGESAFWSLQESIAGARRAEEPLGGTVVPHFEQAICFHDVSFQYDEREIIRDLDMTLESGSITTIIGASGSGKTTVVDLVLGLLRPRQGDITIDGDNLRDINLRAWRDMVGYVPQDTILLHGSILYNVTLDDPRFSQADAENALRAAGAWSFVEALDAGMNSIVGERGGKLSGGQRQRIAIARALINQPKLLILDEATSALDPDSENAVKQSVDGLRGQVTILAVSHNRAMVEVADKVLRMTNGRIEIADQDSGL